jgi:hypothetical protein
VLIAQRITPKTTKTITKVIRDIEFLVSFWIGRSISGTLLWRLFACVQTPLSVQLEIVVRAEMEESYPIRRPDSGPKSPKADNSHRTTTMTTTTFRIFLMVLSIGM